LLWAKQAASEQKRWLFTQALDGVPACIAPQNAYKTSCSLNKNPVNLKTA
jgi:hypothetical protein